MRIIDTLYFDWQKGRLVETDSMGVEIGRFFVYLKMKYLFRVRRWRSQTGFSPWEET